MISSVAARFFLPQIGGAGAVPVGTAAEYSASITMRSSTRRRTCSISRWKRGPWFGFNWRYDSGLVAGSVPFASSANPSDPRFQVDLSGLTARSGVSGGLVCNGQRATPTSALPTSCAGSQFASSLVKIPAPETENDDKNPPRIAPRHLFDLAVGDDNVFQRDRYKVSLQFTAVNLTNKYALYNFLSTFSGHTI